LQAYEEAGNRAIKAAADVARRVHATGEALTARQPPRAVRAVKLRESAALWAWARAKGLLIDELGFDLKWTAQGRIGGQENDVYLENRRVFKRNNLSYHLSYADFFDRLALHNVSRADEGARADRREYEWSI
jgi:hypothetical protein